MKIELAPSETVIREGGANLQRGWEAVGGRLFLTNRPGPRRFHSRPYGRSRRAGRNSSASCRLHRTPCRSAPTRANYDS